MQGSLSENVRRTSTSIPYAVLVSSVLTLFAPIASALDTFDIQVCEAMHDGKERLGCYREIYPSGTCKIDKDEMSCFERENREFVARSELAQKAEKQRKIREEAETQAAQKKRSDQEMVLQQAKAAEQARIEASRPKPGVGDAVGDAFRLCAALKSTGKVTQCDVDGGDSTVSATIDMTSSEAQKTCVSTADMLAQKTRSFSGKWELRLYSPYGSRPIAACTLL
jgi:hypothetical protein